MMFSSRREKIFALGVSLCAFFFIGIVWWVNHPKVHSPVFFVVQIEGAVRNPGVYKVPEGTRLFELIEYAGGAQDNANLQGLNLAAFLYDGQKITVPFLLPPSGEDKVHAASRVPPPSGTFLVNVNTASLKELESLPGIGAVLAQRIIEYREQHGPFRTLEDLLKVKGIGPKKLEKLRDCVTF
ncbi:MAG: ComEA family DNA-binding protein [Atribacterota bacterium]